MRNTFALKSESRDVWQQLPLQQMKVVCVNVRVIHSQSTCLKLVTTQALKKKKGINILLLPNPHSLELKVLCGGAN